MHAGRDLPGRHTGEPEVDDLPQGRLHLRRAPLQVLIQIEPFGTAAALTATGLLHAGHPWPAIHAIHAARPSAALPVGRFLLTLKPELYDGTGVQAVHPDQ
ncbi:hypothetical protein ABZ464_51795 [Streptomyces sp. NPDC005820]|uniref:hypothetical protein n=1 Tax=Streptomyces sp. NPDC005820 TaxID=3157069 RepID=UPI0033C9BB3C